MNVFLLLASIDSDDPLPGVGPMSPATRERLVLLGALFLLVLALVLVTVILRSRRNRHAAGNGSRRRRHRSVKRTAAGVAQLKQAYEHKQRPRHEHRSRNPTLAETGGLPPVRSENPPEPPQINPQPQ